MTGPARLLIVGYYGHGNTGDEAVLGGLLHGLGTATDELSRPLEPLVVSQDPEATRREHGVRVVPARRLLSLLRALRDTDMLVLGGGSLFQEATSRRSILYYAGLAGMALGLGKPVVICAQGVGPLRSRLGKAVVSALFRRAAAITVRDPQARRQAWQLLAATHAPPVVLAADLAFLLRPPERERGRKLLQRVLRRSGKINGTGRTFVGLCLRPLPGKGRAVAHQEQALIRGIREAVGALAYRRPDVMYVWLPFHREVDLELSERLREQCGGLVIPELPYREMLDLVAGLDLVIGMRLHSLIAAFRGGVPLVAICYDPKVDGFVEYLRQLSIRSSSPPSGGAEVIADERSTMVPVVPLPPADKESGEESIIWGQRLVDSIEHAWAQRESISGLWRRVDTALADLAVANCRLVFEVLNRYLQDG